MVEEEEGEEEDGEEGGTDGGVVVVVVFAGLSPGSLRNTLANLTQLFYLWSQSQ